MRFAAFLICLLTFAWLKNLFDAIVILAEFERMTSWPTKAPESCGPLFRKVGHTL